MNTHKNARLTFYSRELMIRRIREEGWPVRPPMPQAYPKGAPRLQMAGALSRRGSGALHNRRPVPRRVRHRMPQNQIALIEALRRQRLSGPRQTGLPRSTVGAVLRRLGLSRLKRAATAGLSTAFSSHDGASNRRPLIIFACRFAARSNLPTESTVPFSPRDNLSSFAICNVNPSNAEGYRWLIQAHKFDALGVDVGN